MARAVCWRLILALIFFPWDGWWGSQVVGVGGGGWGIAVAVLALLPRWDVGEGGVCNCFVIAPVVVASTTFCAAGFGGAGVGGRGGTAGGHGGVVAVCACVCLAATAAALAVGTSRGDGGRCAVALDGIDWGMVGGFTILEGVAELAGGGVGLEEMDVHIFVGLADAA